MIYIKLQQKWKWKMSKLLNKVNSMYNNNIKSKYKYYLKLFILFKYIIYKQKTIRIKVIVIRKREFF